MATIDSLIAAKRAKIASRVALESDLTDEIIKDLAQLKQAGLDADGSAPTVVDSASIGSGIDSSTDIDAIKALLTNILGELVNSKAFADVVVQDSVKTPFIRREEVDQTTGLRTIRIENFDGSLGAPVGAIVPIKSGGDSIIEDQYYAKAAGSDFSLGDSLSSLKVVDEARTVTLLGWFNITTQSVIAAPPTTAIKGYEDLIEELLSKLITQLPATLGAKTAASSLSVALATDTTLPLPPGAATEANQDEEILALEAIGSSVALAATESTLIDIENRLIAIETNTLAPSIRPLSPATDGVTVESTVLATTVKQDEQKAALDLIDGKLDLVSTESTLLAVRDKLAAIEANTLAPNSRPLTPAVDAVRVESATLATVSKQDEQKAVLDAIDQKLALASTAGLQSTAIDKLNQILIELSKQKEFEDLIVQDTVGTAFVRREVLNESTNARTITIENFDGTVGAPVGAVTVVKQIKGNNIVTRNYYAKIAGADFAAGDSLSTMQIVNGETNVVTMLGWFNITQQTSIAAPPTAAIEGYEDRNEELLSAIRSALPATLGTKPSADSLAVALASDTVLPLPINAATESTLTQLLESLGTLADISLPASAFDEATDKGLFRLIAKLITEASAAEIAALGESLETDLIGSPGDFGSLKAVMRGAWYDQRNILGDTGDVSTGGIFDAGSVKMLIRALGNLITNGEQLTRIYDPVTEQRASITAPTQRATNEPALVVAISPDTPIDINQLPGNVQADIAAIKNNTARISQYQFQLVEDATNTVFVARYDTVTGVVANLTLGGSSYTPSGAIDVVASGGGGSSLSLEVNEFEAATASAGNWAIEDVLTRVMIVNTSTGAVSATIWQSASGATLATIPIVGTDVIDTDKRQLALLRALPTAGTPVTGESLATGAGMFGWLSSLRVLTAGLATALGVAVDPVATSDTGTFSLIALIKRLGTKIPALGSALSAGSLPVTIATDQVVPMALADKHMIGPAQNAAAGVNVLAPTSGSIAAIDLSGYRSFSIQITPNLNIANQWILEGSNDNVNFVPAPCVDQVNPNVLIYGTNISYSIFPIVYIGRRTHRYLRARNISGLAGGITSTVQAVTTLSPLDIVLPTSVGITPGTVVGSQLAATANIVDQAFSTASPIGTTAAFSPTWGTAISFTYAVTMAAGSNLIVSVQELAPGGWVNLHTWPIAIATAGNLFLGDTSPVFPVTAKFYRFAYSSTSNGGGTWTITLSHNQWNNAPILLKDAAIDTQLSMNAQASDALNVEGKGVASFTLSGSTWSGTAQVQVSGNGIAWSSIVINNALYSPVTKAFINNGNITANGVYEINCAGLKAVRLFSLSGGAGIATVAIRASNASSIVAIEGQVNAQISNTNLLVRSDSVSNSSDLNGTITATTSSITFSQTWGVSRATEINITAISAGTSYTCEWQEPVGASWRTVYRFAPITVAGVFRSPLLPNVNSNWRYFETISGPTPSVTRAITRTQSNLDVAQAIVPTRTGGFNPINAGFDLPLYGRTRRIVATNRTANLYFLQIHNSATALTLGAVPLAAEVYQLPSNATLPFTVADLGAEGTLFGVNPRLALSTTLNSYTPITSVAAGAISLFVENI